VLGAQQADTSQLPFTGLDVWLIGLVGGLILLTGLMGRRLASRGV
jgi:hypothetical protein